MSVGVMMIIFALTIGLFWLFFAWMFKVIYKERKIICYTCQKKVLDSGGHRCSKCGGMLYKD